MGTRQIRMQNHRPWVVFRLILWASLPFLIAHSYADNLEVIPVTAETAPGSRPTSFHQATNAQPTHPPLPGYTADCFGENSGETYGFYNGTLAPQKPYLAYIDFGPDFADWTLREVFVGYQQYRAATPVEYKVSYHWSETTELGGMVGEPPEFGLFCLNGRELLDPKKGPQWVATWEGEMALPARYLLIELHEPVYEAGAGQAEVVFVGTKK